MPSITVTIPSDFLSQPGVARAIANLTLALGGHDAEEGPAAPAAVKASPPVDETPYAAVPAPHVDDVAELATPAVLGEGALRARWDAYVAGLTDNARKFLSLLERHGRLTILEAGSILSLSGKAVGGIVGPIGRWTPKHGFSVPFTAHENEKGIRYWIWTGVADASDAQSARESRQVEVAAVAAAPVEPADAAVRARWDLHVAGLADNARKFLALLEERGRLMQDEAVALLALPAGKALGGVVGSIGRWTPVAGFKVPYNAEGERGARSWVWTGIAAA